MMCIELSHLIVNEARTLQYIPGCVVDVFKTIRAQEYSSIPSGYNNHDISGIHNLLKIADEYKL